MAKPKWRYYTKSIKNNDGYVFAIVSSKCGFFDDRSTIHMDEKYAFDILNDAQRVMTDSSKTQIQLAYTMIRGEKQANGIPFDTDISQCKW